MSIDQNTRGIFVEPKPRAQLLSVCMYEYGRNVFSEPIGMVMLHSFICSSTLSTSQAVYTYVLGRPVHRSLGIPPVLYLLFFFVKRLVISP